MERKNTILLTVIAVATLLVAVVGSTFAYFAVQVDEKAAKVEINTQTAAANDQFVATGSGKLELNVTNEAMQEVNSTGNPVAVSDTTDDAEKITVSLKAGSNAGATCKYYIQFTAGGSGYTKTSGAEKEYTIEGNAGALEIAETNVDEAGKFGPFTITDAYDADAQQATTQVWDFTARFYNLELNQQTQMGKTHTGSFTVVDVDCQQKQAQ